MGSITTNSKDSRPFCAQLQGQHLAKAKIRCEQQVAYNPMKPYSVLKYSIKQLWDSNGPQLSVLKASKNLLRTAIEHAPILTCVERLKRVS
ncbi:hypothetical protein WA026_004036 [Henosepilachna vigintioctopunctata]|uniref:Uncharacterized protein n=1 Tax=Henosepilachna vigintioctopunctata TaxID=420089 RepID=A0AAW1UEU7_9CUCU